MKKFAIFVDSGANIPTELCAERDIHVVPFYCTVNGVERPCYEEGVSFSHTAKAYYDAMRTGADTKTSLIPSERFETAVEPSLIAGQDAIIFTISSGISGTFKQAQDAADALMARHEGRKVFVVDSANASLGEGLIALKVADLRDLGESAEASFAWTKENTYKMNSFFTVDDLKYLSRGGRISKTLAIAGTLLNVKPILQADSGKSAKIISHSKARGRKKALMAIAAIFAERAVRPESCTVAITHADCEEDALLLADMIREKGAKDIIIEYHDICTGSHVGPGSLALFFWGKDRRVALPSLDAKLAPAPVTHNV